MPRPAGVLQWVRQFAARSADAGATDQDLLARFLTAGDTTALELLIWRHEGMVMGLCSRLLRDVHDAEDAFQATFLTLARKASAIRSGQAVAGWLYRVAYRVALNVLARRRRHTAQFVPLAPAVADALPARAEPAPGNSDVRELLDRAIDRLPQTQRSLVVLCYFEGKTHEEAARLVGCAPGTVASRLARARAKLRTWLARHGSNLSLAAVAVALGEAGAQPAAACGLVTATAQAVKHFVQAGAALRDVSPAAAALSDGAMKALAWAKLKSVALVVTLLAALGVGVGGVMLAPAAPGDQPAAAQQAAPDRVGELVKQLGSPKFAERQTAQQALLKMGPRIVPLLDRWKNRADLETRRRLEQIRYRLVGFAEDILRFLESQSPVYGDKREDVPETIKAVVAAHQPKSGDLLLGLIADERLKLHWPAVNLFAHTWESHSAAQLDTYLHSEFRLRSPYRPRYPAKVAALIEMGYYLHYGSPSLPKELKWQTRTTHYLDGKPYGKPFHYPVSGAACTTGWIRTGELAEGKHVFALTVAYEFTHQGKTHRGQVRSADQAFEVISADTPNELVAPADAATDKRVRALLTILDHEPAPGMNGPFTGRRFVPDVWRPQVTWKTPDGKLAGLHVPVWRMTEPLPVDLCFDVVFEDLTTGKRYKGFELVLLKGKASNLGYLGLGEAVEFAGERSGFVNVRIHLIPSRALALTMPAVTHYYPGTIVVERRMKIVDPNEPRPKER